MNFLNGQSVDGDIALHLNPRVQTREMVLNSRIGGTKYKVRGPIEDIKAVNVSGKVFVLETLLMKKLVHYLSLSVYLSLSGCFCLAVSVCLSLSLQCLHFKLNFLILTMNFIRQSPLWSGYQEDYRRGAGLLSRQFLCQWSILY